MADEEEEENRPPLLQGVINRSLCRRCQSADDLGEDLICAPCVNGDIPAILAAVASTGRAALASGNEKRAQFLRDTYNRLRHCRPGKVVTKKIEPPAKRVVPTSSPPVIVRTMNCIYDGDDCTGKVRLYPGGRRCENHRPQADQFHYAPSHGAELRTADTTAETVGPGSADPVDTG